MHPDLRDVDAALAGSAPVTKADYLRWARSRDLAVQARAFHLSTTAWQRIVPEPTGDEQCEVVSDYLLTCLFTNPDVDDYISSGFEAGHMLAACLKHWIGIPAAGNVIASVAKRLEQLYRDSDPEGRNRIETGALEHILEAPRLRPYFEHWNRDPVLREAYAPALAWGRAHADES